MTVCIVASRVPLGNQLRRKCGLAFNLDPGTYTDTLLLPHTPRFWFSSQHTPKLNFQGDTRHGDHVVKLTFNQSSKFLFELTLKNSVFMFPVLLDQPEIWGSGQPVNPSMESPKLARPFPTGSK